MQQPETLPSELRIEPGSTLANTPLLTLLVNNKQPSQMMQSCKHTCKNDRDKCLKAKIEEISYNRKRAEWQIRKQRRALLIIKCFEQLEATFRYYGVNFKNIIGDDPEALMNERRQQALKDAEFVEGRVDIDAVWQTEQPVMFGFVPVEERRLSFTKLEISFNEEEFTNGAEIKKMITTLID